MPVSAFFLLIFVGRFPHYSREHLVNHAPRYAIVTSCVVFVRKGYCAGRNLNKPNLETSAFINVINLFVCFLLRLDNSGLNLLERFVEVSFVNNNY